MVLARVLFFVATASAFSTPKLSLKSSTSLNYAKELDGMVGTSIEVGNAVWDPLDISDWIPADYLRETELANGRAAMLATVGWFWPNVVGKFDSTDVTTADPIMAIKEADFQWWAQFILLCGTVEAYKYNKNLQGKSYTGVGGDPVFDWSKNYPSDEEGQKKIALQELKNARLAMLGIASFLSAHFIPGSVPALPANF